MINASFVYRLRVATSVFAAVLGSASISARADTTICDGRVISIGNHSPGGLYVQTESVTITKVCDFDAEQYSLSPADCKHLAALVMTAYALERSIRIYIIHIDNAPPTSCSSIPSWHVSSTRYVQLIQ